MISLSSILTSDKIADKFYIYRKDCKKYININMETQKIISQVSNKSGAKKYRRGAIPKILKILGDKFSDFKAFEQLVFISDIDLEGERELKADAKKLENRELVEFTYMDYSGEKHNLYLGRIHCKFTGKQYWTFVDDIKKAYPLRKNGGYASYSLKDDKSTSLKEIIESKDINLILKHFSSKECLKDIMFWDIKYIQYEEFKYLINKDKKEEN